MGKSEEKPEKFIGRAKELARLEELASQKKSSLIALRGRRRIGKSRLAKEFGKGKIFLNFSGLAPEENLTAQDQRDHFVKQLCEQTRIPKPDASDWNNLFMILDQEISKKSTVILFDEISWMALDDPTFLPKLKSAWDDYFSEKKQLVFILCGSVSSWIEKNIISSKGFFGRLTETMTLEELSLQESLELLDTQGFIGSMFEKMMVLSITGGVPWYIELLAKGKSANQTIMHTCFSKNGVLVTEFERIFHDLFVRRSDAYSSIVRVLISGRLSYQEIAEKEAYASGGVLTEYLEDLVLAGFLAMDQNWSFKTGQPQKFKNYRLKDNYLRFYLKHIEPNAHKIQNNLFENTALSSFKGFSSLLGLQFENLVLHNRKIIYEFLGLHEQDIVFASPYFQKKTAKQEACQIDFLIQTQLGLFYICEIKLSTQTLGISVIEEVKSKIKKLKIPRNSAAIPVLIYFGECSEDLLDFGYFPRVLNMGKFFRD